MKKIFYISLVSMFAHAWAAAYFAHINLVEFTVPAIVFTFFSGVIAVRSAERISIRRGWDK